MEEKVLCIYHAKCSDGLGSAYIVGQALSNVDFYAASYADAGPPDEYQKYDVICIVDFSYPPEIINAMAAHVGQIVILDHHVSAIRKFDGAKVAPNVTTVFDTKLSGVGLTWTYFYGSKPLHPVLAAIQDRDLWLFEFDVTEYISAYIFSLPAEIESIAQAIRAYDAGPDHVIDMGKALRAKELKWVHDLADACVEEWVLPDSRGHLYKVPVANCAWMFASDLGHELCTRYPAAPYSLTYFVNSRGQVKVSLRSTKDGDDVSVMAEKLFGGGGHPTAAGGYMDRSAFFALGSSMWLPDSREAADFLAAAEGHMRDRAATYDKPDGERSIGATVAAFRAITGDAVMNSEERGWMFMSLLKKVRSQQGAFRVDNYEDDVAYSALEAEAAYRERGKQK